MGGQRFLAVSPGVLAAWTTPLDGLTPREWEFAIARVLAAGRGLATQACKLAEASGITYDKRVRRKLGPLSNSALAALVSEQLRATLGVMPERLPAPKSRL